MRKDKGFTIVELVIAIPVIIIVMVGVMGFLITLLTDFSNQRVKQTLGVTGQTALQQIEADVKLSSAFLTTTDNSTYPDTYRPNNSEWSIAGSSASFRTLILQTYATDSNPLADIRSPVYINVEGCSGSARYANKVLSNTTIYFIKGSSLYRRILTNPATATPNYTCGTPFQAKSCPSDINPRDASCKVDDTELLRNVSEFTVNYYVDSLSADSDKIDAYTSTIDPGVLDGAMAVEVSFKHQLDGSKEINSGKLRITRLN